MTNLPPWSVKGVEPEAREAAKIAARRAGMTLGQWLSHTVRAAAAEQLRHGGRGSAGSDALLSPPSRSGPEEARLGESHPGAQPPAPTMQTIFESIQKLSARIEAAESKSAEAIAPLAEQVGSLTGQIEALKDQNGVGAAPVERAVSRLSERLQKIEQEIKSPGHRSRRWGFFGFSR